MFIQCWWKRKRQTDGRSSGLTFPTWGWILQICEGLFGTSREPWPFVNTHKPFFKVSLTNPFLSLHGLTRWLQHRELKKEQIEAMRNLCVEQYKTEHDLQMKYHPQLYDLLKVLMSTSHEDHFKKLDQIHDKEVCCWSPRAHSRVKNSRFLEYYQDGEFLHTCESGLKLRVVLPYAGSTPGLLRLLRTGNQKGRSLIAVERFVKGQVHHFMCFNLRLLRWLIWKRNWTPRIGRKWRHWPRSTKTRQSWIESSVKRRRSTFKWLCKKGKK